MKIIFFAYMNCYNLMFRACWPLFPGTLAAAQFTKQGHRSPGIRSGYKQVIVVECGHHIATDPGLSQSTGNGCCKSNRL